jgi:hypothetical protein
LLWTGAPSRMQVCAGGAPMIDTFVPPASL